MGIAKARLRRVGESALGAATAALLVGGILWIGYHIARGLIMAQMPFGLY